MNDYSKLKKILEELVKIDGGFDRNIEEKDFDYIKKFLLNQNFQKLEIIKDDIGGSNLFSLQINDNSRSSEIDLMFLGHLDVVDPGDLNQWRNKEPFRLFEENGILYGRGVVDMKGSIAAFLNAISNSKNLNFNLGIMLVSDEEKESRGAIALRDYVEGYKIKQILIGEPTSEKEIGDVIKIGRRGSANFDLEIFGIQGHVAYPESCQNPIHDFLPKILSKLTEYRFNDKNEFFDSSNLVVTGIETEPKGARNVTPSKIKISFNIRYNSEQSLDSIKEILKDLLEETHLSPEVYNLKVFSNFAPFLSKKTEFCDKLSCAIKNIKGFKPEIKTNGGTSDGRFFHDISEIIEFGALNRTAHKVDENIPLSDLYELSQIYFYVLQNF